MLVKRLPEVDAFLARKHGHFIGGKPVADDATPRIDVVNPADGEVVASVASAGADTVNAAVDAASAAFRGVWRDTLPAERANVLLKMADLFGKYREELAQIETAQSGKLINISRAFEVDAAAGFLRHYAGAATRITGQTITPSLPSMAGEKYTAFTRREPLGVVAGIVPWNFSIMIAVWKFAAAIATGCTVIIKPSEFTPLTMMRVAEIAIEAGLPAGVLNVVNGTGAVGAALIAHDRVAKVSFTGSVPTGIKVGTAALQAKLTRFTLELGGKNPAGFLRDVPVEKIVDGVFEAGFIHQGQICAAAERFYVHRSQIDAVLAGVKARLGAMKAGDPMDESADFGPLSNRPHLEKVAAAFREARDEGDEIVVGGEVLDRPGFYVTPTAIRVFGPQARLMQDETFGPVGSFIAYDTEKEMIEAMNATPFGLSASLWTGDLSKALRLVPLIEAGTVWVNMHTILDPSVPFGGAKSSGLGREFGDAFIEDYTELKSVMIRY